MNDFMIQLLTSLALLFCVTFIIFNGSSSSKNKKKDSPKINNRKPSNQIKMDKAIAEEDPKVEENKRISNGVQKENEDIQQNPSNQTTDHDNERLSSKAEPRKKSSSNKSVPLVQQDNGQQTPSSHANDDKSGQSIQGSNEQEESLSDKIQTEEANDIGDQDMVHDNDKNYINDTVDTNDTNVENQAHNEMSTLNGDDDATLNNESESKSTRIHSKNSRDSGRKTSYANTPHREASAKDKPFIPNLDNESLFGRDGESIQSPIPDDQEINYGSNSEEQSTDAGNRLKSEDDVKEPTKFFQTPRNFNLNIKLAEFLESPIANGSSTIQPNTKYFDLEGDMIEKEDKKSPDLNRTNSKQENKNRFITPRITSKIILVDEIPKSPSEEIPSMIPNTKCSDLEADLVKNKDFNENPNHQSVMKDIPSSFLTPRYFNSTIQIVDKIDFALTNEISVIQAKTLQSENDIQDSNIQDIPEVKVEKVSFIHSARKSYSKIVWVDN